MKGFSLKLSTDNAKQAQQQMLDVHNANNLSHVCILFATQHFGVDSWSILPNISSNLSNCGRLVLSIWTSHHNCWDTALLNQINLGSQGLFHTSDKMCKILFHAIFAISCVLGIVQLPMLLLCDCVCCMNLQHIVSSR